ncbi:hypothetical protein X765_32115 [Mesorhizobium sp. LSHC440B00]|nr:hypothetical protein X765_32115 [Mesorhizobium sp. LSHC440B00]
MNIHKNARLTPLLAIDGRQTNHEPIRSCDLENRLRHRSRRALKPIRIRKSQYFNN